MCCTCWTFSNPLYICKTWESNMELHPPCSLKIGKCNVSAPWHSISSSTSTWRMETAHWLYQMTFLKERLRGEGVFGSALNLIIDNIATLCNMLSLWWRFGKVTAKIQSFHSAQSCRARSECLLWELSGFFFPWQCNLFVWEQQEIPV